MSKENTFAGKSVAELTELEAATRKELFELKFQHATRPLANPMELKAKKRELARVLTAKNQQPKG